MLRFLRFGRQPESNDVPDHRQPDLESLEDTLAGSLGLAHPSSQPNGNLDYGQPARHGDEEHVNREVISADREVGQDALERRSPDSPKSASDVGEPRRTEVAAVPKAQ